MNKSQIKVNGVYSLVISGQKVNARVNRINDVFVGSKTMTRYACTNLTTGRNIVVKSAQRFRSEVITGTGDMTKSKTPKQEAAKVEVPFSPALVTIDTVAPVTTAPESAPATSAGTPETPEWLSGTPSCPVAASAALDSAFDALERPNVPVDAVGDSGTMNNGTPKLGIAAKIAARHEQEAKANVVQLTDEQASILAVAQEIQQARDNGERVLVIGAGAGTGKTFTLKQLEMALEGKGQYTAFNKSLVEESRTKFKVASVNTTHSLAFREVGRHFSHRLSGNRIKSWQVAEIVGLDDLNIDVSNPESGAPEIRCLKASWLAGKCTGALKRFSQSADAEIDIKHFAYIDGIDHKTLEGKRTYENNDRIKEFLLPYARKMWEDAVDPQGTLPYSADFYVKLWQLSGKAIIPADYILLDEHQDTAPVFVDILKQNLDHAMLILVGDDNQRIYEWRGAINAGAEFPNATRRLLSQSFRFGQTVADIANTILFGLEEKTDLVMSGLSSIPSRVCKVAAPRCYLYRTNAGAIGRLMAAKEAKQTGHLIGGSKEVVDFCKAAHDLQSGKRTGHPDLGCFTDWDEVVAYSKEEEGEDLRLMVRLIEKFGAVAIKDALERMPKEENADIILSTAHRSKGREWSSVKLGSDFPLADRLSDSDRRLLYVASTRAQEELDISECPTFCGGYDKKFGGENGSGGEEKWIPGIKITYTVDMPTAEDVAAYRTEKGIRQAEKAAVEAAKVEETPVVEEVETASETIEFSWAKQGEEWCVKGPEGHQGKKVTVTKRSGQKTQETLRSIVKIAYGFCFYSTRAVI